MGLDLLEKVTNAYERKARLFPALLALVPVLVLVVELYGIELKVEAGFIGLLATFGIFYLAASVVRELGKRLENSLFDEWGGKPTTQMLRHRDKTIDPVTKARYHTFLAKHLGVNFPSMADEEADPIAADNTYQSGIKWLLDRTRDTKTFNLLFQENIAFGFIRNCLGLKPFAIAIAVSTFFWPLFTYAVITRCGVELDAFKGFPNGAWVSLAISLLMLAVWIFFLTKRTAKTAAFGYADMLLRACDVLPKKR